MNIQDYSSELRALFTKVLDVETGDGACALSLLDSLEAKYTKEYTADAKRTLQLESSDEKEPSKNSDLAEHVADMFDLVLEMILELNLRTKKLESNAQSNRRD